MQYYRDARTGAIVRTIDDSFRLEYIVKGATDWEQTEHDDPYEREHWLGEGSQCLDDISEEEAIAIIASWQA